MKNATQDLLNSNQIFMWIALLTGLLLLVPLFAMQLMSEFNWSWSDFIIMGTLIFGFGSTFVITARKIKQQYRITVGFAFLLVFLWIWAELAVGVFTSRGS